MRMFYYVIGHDKFFDGLSNYFKKYGYGNTDKMDLLREWDNVCDGNVSKKMLTWIDQVG